MRDAPEDLQSENIWDQEPNYIPIEQEIALEKKEKRKKRVKSVIAVIVAFLFIFANLIFFTSSFQETPDPIPPGYYIEMVNTNIIEYQFSGEFPAEYMQGLREIIDIRGNEDGKVSEEEVKDYEEFCIDSAEDSYAPGFRINGSRGRYTRYNMALGGATGDVNSEKPMTHYVSYKVNWRSIDEDESSYHIYKSNYFDLEFDFKFKAPTGYMINEVHGLKNAKYNSDATIVSGITDGEAPGVDLYILRLL